MCKQYNMIFFTHYVSYNSKKFSVANKFTFKKTFLVVVIGRDSREIDSLYIFHIINIEMVYFTLCLDHKNMQQFIFIILMDVYMVK